MRHSDAVLATALRLAGRTEAITATGLSALRHRLAGTVAQIDELMSDDGTNGDEKSQPPKPD